ncbi:MAG TPA: PilZ domain-containing protein [Terriglobia bacterium]|nr:PilZ domain-containing protein [Terriglobia bacterium]
MEWTHLRKYPRVPVDLSAVYTLNARTRRARILTLGGGGLFLADPEPIAVGARLSIRFRPAKHFPPLEVQAEVRYVISGKGMGMEFLDIDAEYRQRLMTFIIHRTGETRQFSRAPLAAQVEHAGGSQIGFSRNISVGGMFIETKKPVATGTHLKMRFNLDDDGPTIIVDGEVRYAVEKVGMGVRFLNLSLADQKRIDVYLAKGDASAGHR